jgi:hypothetical protein
VIGIIIIGLFVFTIVFTSIFQKDWNIQERSFEKKEDIVYIERDDRWYSGTRVSYRITLRTFFKWIIGKQLVSTRDGTQKWLSNQQVIEYEHIFRPPPLWTCLPAQRQETDVENGVSPLFGNYMRAYTPLSAFVINNFIVGFSTALASEIRLMYDVEMINGFSITFGLIFLSGTTSMLMFFYLFGYGEGLLAPKGPRVLSNELIEDVFKGRLRAAPNEAFVLTETSNLFAPRVKYNYISKVYLAPTKTRARRQ